MPEPRWTCSKCWRSFRESQLSRTPVTVKRVAPPHVIVERQTVPCCPACWGTTLVELTLYAVN